MSMTHINSANGKSYVNPVESRAKKYAPVQRVSDYEMPAPAPEENKEEAGKISVAIARQQNGGYRLRISVPSELYCSIGAPKRIAVTSMPGQKLRLRKSATGLKPQYFRNRVIIDVGVVRLGVRKVALKAANVIAEFHTERIILSDLPRGFFLDNAVPESSADPIIMPELAAETGSHQSTHEIGLSIQPNGPSSFSFRFSVPLDLIGKIDDPKRVIIIGTPHEGFKIEPVHEGGIAVNYSTGTKLYLQTGIAGKKISRQRRKSVLVGAHVKDSKIVISGPPHDWIAGAPMWLHDDKPASVNDKPGRLTEGPLRGEGTAVLPKPSSGIAALAPINEIAQALKKRLQEILGEAVKIRDELTQKTGLEFVITKDGRLMVK